MSNLSRPRYMRRYGRRLPLIGDSINRCLDEIEMILENREAGAIVRIVGEGGTGKSESLEQLRYYFYGSEAISANNLPELSKVETLEWDDNLLFGGVIDLYNSDTFNGRGIELKLIENWTQYYDTRGEDFTQYVKYAPERARPETAIFNEFLKEYNDYRELRFALPNLEGAEDLIAERNKQLDILFFNGLQVLCSVFTPVICFDTAELLVQRNYRGKIVSEFSDSLNWLYKFLNNNLRRKCILIIAGRPIDDELINVLDANRSYEQKNFEDLFKVSKTYRLHKLDALTTEELKQYVYHYRISLQDIFLNAKVELGMVADHITNTVVEEEWKEFLEIQVYRQNLVLQEGVDPIEAIKILTEGKPLLIDWFCQLTKIFVGQTLDEITNAGNVRYISTFKRRLGRLFLSPDPAIISLPADVTHQEVEQVLNYVFVARQGLNVQTIVWLSENYPSHTVITTHNARLIVKELTLNPFFKVRNLRPSAELHPNMLLVKYDELLITLHDEVYTSIVQIAQEDHYVSRTMRALASLMAQSFSSYNFSGSFREIESRMKGLQEIKLVISDNSGMPNEEDWFQETKLPNSFIEVTDDRAKANVKDFLIADREIKDNLVKRLYYLLRHNYFLGYEEYCRIITTAIEEFDEEFSARAQRQLQQFEQELIKNDMGAYDWIHHTEDGDYTEEDIYYFAAMRFFEAELQNAKRRYILEVRANNAAGGGTSDPDDLSLNDLAKLPLEDILTDQHVKELADKEELAPVTLPLDAEGKFDLNALTSERAKAFVNRIKLAQADALLSWNDHEGQTISIKQITALIQILRHEVQLPAQTVIEQQPGRAEEGDFAQWYRRILLGRAYNALGLKYQSLYDYDKAIASFSRALEFYRAAFLRNDVYVNDTLNNLAYMYLQRGRRNIATEIVRNSLTNQRSAGHRVYVALTENILAEVRMAAENLMERAYRTSLGALGRFGSNFTMIERDNLFQYNLLLFANARIARRLGRLYATRNLENFENVIWLHLVAEQRLLKIRAFFVGKNVTLAQRSLAELGCVYRSLGRSLALMLRAQATDQLVLRPIDELYNSKKPELNSVAHDFLYNLFKLFQNHPWETSPQITWDEVVQRILSESEKVFTTALAECNTAPNALWLQRIETQLDLAQTVTYKFTLELAGAEEVEKAFAEVDSLLDQLKELILTGDADDETLPGKQSHYCLLNGKISSRRADWQHVLYQRRLQESRQKQNTVPVEPNKHLAEYTRRQIEALAWFMRFQPQLLGADKMSFFRDLNYINRIERRLNRDISRINERYFAIEVAKELAAHLPQTAQTNIELTPDWDNGLQLFSIMFDCAIELARYKDCLGFNP